MPAHLIKSPFQFEDANGLPVVGGTVETYEPNGSSVAKPLYSDKALTASVGATQTLNSLGMFTAELFGSGDYYMIVKYADGTTAYDMEYIEGEGSGNNAATEWEASVTPTFISTTSFSVAGDLTSDFHTNRRIKTENTGGTIYSTIASSAFTTLTTVTIINDSGVLDSGLSSVELGFLRADNQSMPASKAGLIDSSGNQVVKVAATVSAVNEITVTNAATGNGPTIEATGTDTDIDVTVLGKGAGYHRTSGGPTGGFQGSTYILDALPATADNTDTGSANTAWTTLNLSVLNGTGAKAAIIQILNKLSTSSTGSQQVYLAKSGQIGNPSTLTFIKSTTNNNITEDNAQVLVPLDTNQDFQYAINRVFANATSYVAFRVVGYYV